MLRGTVLLLITAGALALQAQGARAQTFTAPVNISGDTTGFSARTVVDSSGNIDIGYLDAGSDSSGNPLWLVRGTFSGGAFHAISGPVEVAARAGGSFSMALESDCVIDFAYADGIAAEGLNIFFAQSADCGASFRASNITNNSSASTNVSSPQLVVSGGVAHIVWALQVNGANASSIMHVQRGKDGSFTGPEQIGTSSPGAPCLVEFAVPGSGNAAAGWCDGNKGNVWAVTSVNSGQAVALGTGEAAQFGADGSGNIFAAWDDPNQSAIWFSRSSGPGSFTAAKQLFAVTDETESVSQIGLDASGAINLLMSVEQRTGTPDRSTDTIALSLSRSSDGGNTFSNPVSIATLSCALCGSGVPAQMAVDGAGDANVAWEALGGWSPAGSSFSRLNAQGTAFSPPVTIPGNPAGNVAMTTDASGHALLAWSGQGVFVSEVSAPRGFAMSMTPAAFSIMPGGTATAQLALTATGGFDQTVNLSCSNLPTGAACLFDPTSAIPTSSGAIVTVTVTIPPTLPAGNFPFTIAATSPFMNEFQSTQAVVGLPAGTVTPNSATIPVGGSARFTVSLTGTNGVTGQFNLACSAPAGVSCTFNPNSVFVPFNGRVSAILTAQVVNVPPTAFVAKGPRDNSPMGLLDVVRTMALYPAGDITLACLLFLLLLIARAFGVGPQQAGSWKSPGKSVCLRVARGTAAAGLRVILGAALISCGGAVSKNTIGGGTTGTASATTPAGSTSMTFPMTVVAESGGSIVNVGTVSVTVP